MGGQSWTTDYRFSCFDQMNRMNLSGFLEGKGSVKECFRSCFINIINLVLNLLDQVGSCWAKSQSGLIC